jgi:hypothetical protein
MAESPYGSSTLQQGRVVTHKVIHKKCEELFGIKSALMWTRTDVLKIYA